MQNLHLTVLSALFIIGLAGCASQSIDPSSAAYDQNDKDIQTYATQKNLNGKTTASGLYYVITSANPAGKQPALGEEVEFTYKTYNLKDVLVDSSGTLRPVYYPIGIQAILAGLEEGLSIMRENEKATLLLPSYLAYGSNVVNTNLPAYSVVRFDVQLNRSRTEDQQIDDYIAKNNLKVTEKTTSGIRFILTKADSTGGVPATGRTLTIKYLGKQLQRASAFDSTGTGTFDAILGQSKYVKGFEEGLSKLKLGQKATVIFPSSLGYAASGVRNNNTYLITPYAPLRFDLELISAK